MFSRPSPTRRAGRFSRADARWRADRSRIDAPRGDLAACRFKAPGVLKRAKLVRHRHEGRETHYSAQPQALAPLVDWMITMAPSGANDLIGSKRLTGKDGQMTDTARRTLTRD
jgi:hypothetical protein